VCLLSPSDIMYTVDTMDHTWATWVLLYYINFDFQYFDLEFCWDIFYMCLGRDCNNFLCLTMSDNLGNLQFVINRL
jgi:hypothetical protein